jgi:HEAT repeat protein
LRRSLIDAFRIWGRLRRDDTLKLARVLRTSVTVPLLDALCNEESSAYRKFYISILSQLGKEVLQEASERLNNDRWFVVRNMIYLLRECGGLEYLQSVRNLTRHNNDRVQLEALKTLVYFKDPSGVPQLMSILKRKDRWLKEQAIKICGIYRIEETLPYLENILKKRDIFSSHLYLKLAAINALCRIGSPRAFDTLKKVFTEKVHLYKGTQAELQSEVIKSMENYSDAGVKSILKLAMNSEHEEIRELARKTFSGGNSG